MTQSPTSSRRSRNSWRRWNHPHQIQRLTQGRTRLMARTRRAPWRRRRRTWNLEPRHCHSAPLTFCSAARCYHLLPCWASSARRSDEASASRAQIRSYRPCLCPWGGGVTMATKIPRRDGPTPKDNRRVLLEEFQRASLIRTLALGRCFFVPLVGPAPIAFWGLTHLRSWECRASLWHLWLCHVDQQMWRCEDVDQQMWRCEDVDQQMWECEDVDQQVWRCEDVKVWRCRSADVRVWRCRSAGVKVWRCRSENVRVWRCI